MTNRTSTQSPAEQFKLLKLISLSLLATPILLTVFATSIGDTATSAEGSSETSVILVGMALLMSVLAPYGRSFMLRSMKRTMTTQPTPSEIMSRYFAGSMLTYMLWESVAILGFASASISGAPETAYSLCILSMIGIFFSLPKEEHVRALFSSQGHFFK